MSNGSNKALMASRRVLDPYGYVSEDESSDSEEINTSRNEFPTTPVVRTHDNLLDKKYGIGARLLSRMGYVAGKGLGKDGSGIANPIQVEPRANASVGLGVLSDKRASNNETTDSSDEEQALRSHNIVAFTKTTTETLSKDKEKQGLCKVIKQRISELQCRMPLQTSSELLKKVDEASTDQIQNLKTIIDKLLENQGDSEGINRRIQVLEQELSVLKDEEKQLIDIGEDLKETATVSLLDKASKILSLSDPELVDKSICRLLRHWCAVSNSAETPLEDERLVELVEMLQYQMDAATFQLNRSQTQLHQIIFSKFLNQWQNFVVAKEQVGRMIFILLDLEPVMKFIGCFDYVREKFIYPKLLGALESWNIVESIDYPPRLWVFDFMVVVNQSTRDKIEDIVARKIGEYFRTWYHRDSELISRPDLMFIQELLGKRYSELLKTEFLPEFIKQLWDKHFDPLLDLEDSETISIDQGSIYYLKTLLNYKYYFDSKVFMILLQAVFNEYNKIIYQWLLYSSKQDAGKSKYWFNSIINQVFRDLTPSDLELVHIRATLSLLDRATDKPIHDESFNLLKELNMSQTTEESGNSSYTIQNIPLRKVSTTFKNVVEDFCEENGYLLEKLQGAYAQLPCGLHKDTLAPLFKLSRGTTTLKVAINEDVLWVEKGKGEFVPTYLYELK